MSLNLPGSVVISGLAFLENVRTPDPEKLKTLAFDAVFRLSDECGPAQDAAVAHLTYYNADNLPFTEESTPFFIVAKIAKVEYGPSPATQAPIMLSTTASLKNEDYCFVGDIETLLPATPECAQHVGCKVHITISGIVERGLDYEKEVSFFYLSPTQYVSVYHKKFDATFKSTLPIQCVIKESQRWTAITKPKPRPGKVAVINGFIGEIVRTSDEKVECIEVIPDQVIYLTEVQLPASKLQNTLDSASTPDSKRKLKFAGFGTPSPASNKRLKALPISDLDGSSMESITLPSSPSPAPSASSATPTITLPARSAVSGPAAAAMNRNKTRTPAGASN